MSDDVQRARAAFKRLQHSDELDGYMGKPDGAGGWTYAVPHHPGYVYVRIIHGTQISIAEAINQGAAENPDVLVKIEREKGILVVRRPDAASAAHVLGTDINDALLLGAGGGITHSYVGYNTVGGSTETIASNGRTTIYKPITIATTGLLVSIGAHIVASQTTLNPTTIGLQVLVLSDNSGAPDYVIALGPTVNTHVIGTTARWIDLPITKLLTAGDYWLAFRGTGNGSNVAYIAYDSGGSDRTYDAGAAITVDHPPYGTTSAASKDYSIRGGILR